MWQDFVFTAGSIIFVIALLPSLFSEAKPALSTSIMTGSVLLVFAATYATMGFYFSGSVTCITALIWLTLAYQKGIE